MYCMHDSCKNRRLTTVLLKPGRLYKLFLCQLKHVLKQCARLATVHYEDGTMMLSNQEPPKKPGYDKYDWQPFPQKA